jgi:hypothetical protein
MRWIVEASSLGKTDLQKFVIEAESWQRALQAARAQRGEEGPMSGFSIELLEEGYRAVDPVARIRFVVKRAPDDMPVTAPLAKDAKAGIAPTRPSTAPPSADAKPSTPPTAGKSVPPRPFDSKTTNGGSVAPKADSKGPASQPPPIGSALPGLPAAKIVAAREQDPTEASPLTYREYSFVVPLGTSEEVAVEVLRGQLKLVEAQLGGAKMGKLVNLAVFDAEFSGKPPPPIATLSWKDWKGAAVIGYPRRGASQKQVKPPSQPPAAAQDTAPTSSLFPDPATTSLPPPPVASVPPPPVASVPPPAIAGAPPAPPAQSPYPVSPSSVPPPPPFVAPTPVIPQAGLPQRPASVPPHAVVVPAPVTVSPSAPPPAFPQAPTAAPAISEKLVAAEPMPGSSRRGSSPDGTIRTPSGRYIRGRTTGDELITSLFESMHDLHFLRDALDGGQFCLALATEVLPARAALIHFFDLDKREWVVACTRGKDAARLLTLRTPDGDELLREAARHRRAVVTKSTSESTAQRYQTLGTTQSVIIAPIMQAGRALGAIELISPLDGMPFTDDEGNAMTYIAEQYAEYLGSRGIVLDRERIQASAR